MSWLCNQRENFERLWIPRRGFDHQTPVDLNCDLNGMYSWEQGCRGAHCAIYPADDFFRLTDSLLILPCPDHGLGIFCGQFQDIGDNQRAFVESVHFSEWKRGSKFSMIHRCKKEFSCECSTFHEAFPIPGRDRA
jgi:hypothetical protein